jgi:hypothetical protein
MSTESKDFDHYAIVLADLKARRDQLDQAIQAIESVRLGGAAATSVPTSAAPTDNQLGEGAFHGMSISEATKKLLGIRKKKMTNTEVLAALQAGGMVMNSADPLNTVGAVLTRRSKEMGDIVKVERGTWGLKEWYPGKSFNKPSKGNGEVGSKPSPTASEPPSPPDGDESLA